MALLALFRPVLFATTTIGLTLVVLVVLHRQNPPPAPQPVPQAAAKAIALPDPEPSPPITAADFQGFQGFQAKPSQPQPPDPEPPATPSGCTPTYRSPSDRATATVHQDRAAGIGKHVYRCFRASTELA